MNTRKTAALVAATAAGVSATSPADAAIYTAQLVKAALYGNSGSQAANLTTSTAIFAYDSDSQLVYQTDGTLVVRFFTAPSTTLFRTATRGLVIGHGGAASATSFVCQEGNFGAGVGASLCGNYNFGANLVNESSTSWGPGTAASRSLGGDDVAAGDIQSLSVYDGMNTVSWVGTSLVLSNRRCTGSGPCATLPGTYNSGYDLTFSTFITNVPVPAAAWLFGSAVGVLGFARRRRPPPPLPG